MFFTLKAKKLKLEENVDSLENVVIQLREKMEISENVAAVLQNI